MQADGSKTRLPLGKGFASKLRRKQHCLGSSLSCALLRAPRRRGGATDPVDIFVILKMICIFMMTLLIINLGDLYIYYSNFLAIMKPRYSILTKPRYYDNFLTVVSEVSGGKRAFF